MEDFLVGLLAIAIGFDDRAHSSSVSIGRDYQQSESCRITESRNHVAGSSEVSFRLHQFY